MSDCKGLGIEELKILKTLDPDDPSIKNKRRIAWLNWANKHPENNESWPGPCKTCDNYEISKP